MSRGADIGMGEDYVRENNTGQCILLLKYPHKSFSLDHCLETEHKNCPRHIQLGHRGR